MAAQSLSAQNILRKKTDTEAKCTVFSGTEAQKTDEVDLLLCTENHQADELNQEHTKGGQSAQTDVRTGEYMHSKVELYVYVSE